MTAVTTLINQIADGRPHGEDREHSEDPVRGNPQQEQKEQPCVKDCARYKVAPVGSFLAGNPHPEIEKTGDEKEGNNPNFLRGVHHDSTDHEQSKADLRPRALQHWPDSGPSGAGKARKIA